AAGLAVPGVPVNPFPAQIINLSLGGEGSCLPAYRDVFRAALAHGVTRAIVAAAGNERFDASDSVPASCSDVIAVAATTGSGSLASYSDFGAGIALSAPGGSEINWGGGTARRCVAESRPRPESRRCAVAFDADVDGHAVSAGVGLRHFSLRRRDRQCASGGARRAKCRAP